MNKAGYRVRGAWYGVRGRPEIGNQRSEIRIQKSNFEFRISDISGYLMPDT